MDLKKKWMINGIFTIGLGVILILLGIWKSEMLQSMGFAMILVGGMNLLRRIRLSRNEEKMEKLENRNRDERIHFIAGKSNTWTLWISVWVKTALIILFAFWGKEDLSQIFAYLVCGEVILYTVIYGILSRKY